jgi:hypothetical protein
MKILLRIIFLISFFSSAYLFSETKTSSIYLNAPQKRNVHVIKVEGKVSHKFKKSGCGTVIVCKRGKETTILIPAMPLGKYDVDGMDVLVTFRMLRIPNPPGCIKGMPVQILSIMANKK